MSELKDAHLHVFNVVIPAKDYRKVVCNKVYYKRVGKCSIYIAQTGKGSYIFYMYK